MDIDSKELSKKNGKEDTSTYVAVDGKVYDISESRLWKNGTHMNRHEAGKDLSEDLKAAPHGAEVLEKFTLVGKLKKSDQDEVRPPIPEWLHNFLDFFVCGSGR